jgi:N-acylneuraminate cytidylyltransferase
MSVAISIIPARGGSKSIPKKNIALLDGRPLIAHSIENSLQCSKIARTIVSTDDDEIARIARQYGAEVPFTRPPEFARDDTQDFPVLLHALEWLQTHENFTPDLLVFLRPTGPLLPSGLIERAIQMISKDPEADCVRAIAEAPCTPYKMWKKEDKYLKPFAQLEGKESYNMPRQKLPKVYSQQGVLDVIRSSTIFGKRSVSGTRILPVEIESSFLTIDIDQPVDLLMAELFIKYNKNATSNA